MTGQVGSVRLLADAWLATRSDRQCGQRQLATPSGITAGSFAHQQ
jgi:hypothetical protein